jgi:hypothetical protein
MREEISNVVAGEGFTSFWNHNKPVLGGGSDPRGGCMKVKSGSAWMLSFFLLAVLFGCAAQQKPVAEPPAFPGGVADAKWGMEATDVKQAVQTLQDDTAKPPFALYASRNQFDQPATVSYFFTPKSKKLYRTDITFNDPGVYDAVKKRLRETFKEPMFAQADREIWLWKDNSTLVLQKNSSSAQVSFSNGSLVRLNNEEGGEPMKQPPRASSWKTMFQW